MWPNRIRPLSQQEALPDAVRFNASAAIALERTDDLFSLNPAFLAPLHDELGVQSLAARVCPVLLADHSVAIFALAGHEGSDHADALALRVLRHGYRLAEPQRYVVAAPLLLAIARRQLTARPSRQFDVRPSGASSTALAAAFQDMVEWGVRNGASDMHCNVSVDEPESEVRYTVGGRYVAPERFKRMPTSLLMDVLAVAWMDVRGGNGAVFDPTIEQQGRLSRRVDDRAIVLRWASLAADRGPSVCLRLLERQPLAAPGSLEHLGYSREQADMMARAVRVRGGAIVFSGAVGSGKSTTLAALVASLPDTHKVITIEDPVEYIIPRAIQNTVTRDPTGRGDGTYAAKLLAIKRSAMTDVLLGEIRDCDSGRAFMDLAGSGINLYTTVHAPSARLTGERLASDFIRISRDFLATPGVLKLIVHQTLLPRLCGHCALPAHTLCGGARPDGGYAGDGRYWAHWLARMERFLGQSSQGLRVRNPAGCSRCFNSQTPALAGYSGRTVVAECLEPRRHPEFLRALRHGHHATGGGQCADARRPDGGAYGSPALRDALNKAFRGEIDPRDVDACFHPVDGAVAFRGAASAFPLAEVATLGPGVERDPDASLGDPGAGTARAVGENR